MKELSKKVACFANKHQNHGLNLLGIRGLIFEEIWQLNLRTSWTPI